MSAGKLLPSTVVRRRGTFPELSTLLKRIECTYHPSDVLLFGSRAKGEASPDSDWDVLVILPDEADDALLNPLLGWELQRGSGVHADLICSYRGEFLADLRVANSRSREIAEDAIGLISS